MTDQIFKRLLQWLVVFGIAIRLFAIDRYPGINGDEAYPVVLIRDFLQGNPTSFWLPTQRFLSPLFGLWISPVLLAPPSFYALRLPALVAGLALLFFARRLFATRPKLERTLFLVFLATSPVSIAYSRSSVEQCLVPLLSLFPLSFALSARPVAFIVSLAVVVLAHPTGIFLLAFLLPLFFYSLTQRNDLSLYGKQVMGFSVVAGSLIIVAALLLSLPGEYGTENLHRVGLLFLHAPKEALDAIPSFASGWVRFITGETTVEYFSNALPAATSAGLAYSFAIGTLFVAVLGIYRALRNQKHEIIRAVLSYLIFLTALFVVAGPRLMSSGLSRHAVVLLVPTLWILSVLLSSISSRSDSHRWPRLIACLIAATWMVVMIENFFGSIRRGGGFTHRTYISGPVEPKKAVWNWIAQETPIGVTVIVEDWWTYWPLRYLNQPSRAQIILLSPDLSPQSFEDHLRRSAVAVGHQDGPIAQYLRSRYSSSFSAQVETYSAQSYNSNARLVLWRLNPGK